MDLFIVLCFYLILPKANSVISEEQKDKTENEDKTIFNIERRFHQDLDDKEWHVSHLKDSGFGDDSKCQDTFEDKVQKYRQMLKRDGSHVKFVSADTLPVNISDINQGVCRVTVNETVVPTYKTKTDNSNLEFKDQNSKREDAKTLNENTTVKSSPEEINVATTDKAKGGKAKKADEKSRRASEYMFSSVEYYDETEDFDASQCPGDVEVINLQVDDLRNYDYECERLLEWRSLD